MAFVQHARNSSTELRHRRSVNRKRKPVMKKRFTVRASTYNPYDFEPKPRKRSSMYKLKNFYDSVCLKLATKPPQEVYPDMHSNVSRDIIHEEPESYSGTEKFPDMENISHTPQRSYKGKEPIRPNPSDRYPQAERSSQAWKSASTIDVSETPSEVAQSPVLATVPEALSRTPSPMSPVLRTMSPIQKTTSAPTSSERVIRIDRSSRALKTGSTLDLADRDASIERPGSAMDLRAKLARLDRPGSAMSMRERLSRVEKTASLSEVPVRYSRIVKSPTEPVVPEQTSSVPIRYSRIIKDSSPVSMTDKASLALKAAASPIDISETSPLSKLSGTIEKPEPSEITPETTKATESADKPASADKRPSTFGLIKQSSHELRGSGIVRDVETRPPPVKAASTTNLPINSSRGLKSSSTLDVVDPSLRSLKSLSTVDIPKSSSQGVKSSKKVDLPATSSRAMKSTSTLELFETSARALKALSRFEIPESSSRGLKSSSKVDLAERSPVEVKSSVQESQAESSSRGKKPSNQVDRPGSSSRATKSSNTIDIPGRSARAKKSSSTLNLSDRSSPATKSTSILNLGERSSSSEQLPEEVPDLSSSASSSNNTPMAVTPLEGPPARITVAHHGDDLKADSDDPVSLAIKNLKKAQRRTRPADIDTSRSKPAKGRKNDVGTITPTKPVAPKNRYRLYEGPFGTLPYEWY